MNHIILGDIISVKDYLEEFLDGYTKVILLGVGNVLKADDGIGPFIIEKLKEDLIENDSILLINGETVPENFTGKIRKENPSHLILIDACLMDEKDGKVKVVDRENFSNIGISTHSMSLSYFIKYLERDIDFNVLFIGIEPKSMELYEDITGNVKKNAIELIEVIKEIL